MRLLDYVSGDIGMLSFGVRKKEWVEAAIGGALSLGSTLFGASESQRAAKRALEMEEGEHQKQQAYFKRKANESYGDTASGRNMIRQAKEYGDKTWKKAQGASAVGGGTDASTAMAKESGNKVVADALAKGAEISQQRQDAAEAGAIQESSRYTAQKAANERQRGANVASVASAVGNAVGGIVSSMGSVANADSKQKQAELRSDPNFKFTAPAAENATGIDNHKPSNNSDDEIKKLLGSV